VGVDAERCAEAAAGGADGVGDGVGQRAPVGIAQHHAVGAGLRRRCDRSERVLRVEGVAIEEVLGVIDDFFVERLEVRHAVADHGDVLVARGLEHALDMEHRALPDERHHGCVGLRQCHEVRIVGTAHARAASAAERSELGVRQRRLPHALKEVGVLRVRARPAALDVVDAQVVEPLRDLALVLGGQGETGALRAVAQGRVVQDDAHNRLASKNRVRNGARPLGSREAAR
jgi:hypothetical protein